MTNGRRLKPVALTKSKPCAIFIDWLPNDTWIGFVIRFPTMYQRRESLCVCVWTCMHLKKRFSKNNSIFLSGFLFGPLPSSSFDSLFIHAFCRHFTICISLSKFPYAGFSCSIWLDLAACIFHIYHEWYRNCCYHRSIHSNSPCLSMCLYRLLMH